MPDKNGNIKGISVGRVPWHEEESSTNEGRKQAVESGKVTKESTPPVEKR